VVGKDFASAGHLASYAGLAPVTWRSGTSIRGDHSSRRGNKILKRALFLSAFAALKDPLSRAYYDKKRAEHKKHNQALIALARTALQRAVRDAARWRLLPRTRGGDRCLNRVEARCLISPGDRVPDRSSSAFRGY
jgi:transposase